MVLKNAPYRNRGPSNCLLIKKLFIKLNTLYNRLVICFYPMQIITTNPIFFPQDYFIASLFIVPQNFVINY